MLNFEALRHFSIG